jgi:glutaredoxin
MPSERMNVVRIPGKNNQHKVLMYALSTCAWCKLTKQFLKDNEIEYEYVDVDHCNEEDLKNIKNAILSRGGNLSYPALIIDEKILITGFRKDKISEVLGL